MLAQLLLSAALGAAAVRGQVLALGGGGPVAQAHVRAGSAETTADPNGRFVLELPESGPVELDVGADGFLPAHARVEAALAAPPVTLYLRPRGAVLETVVRQTPLGAMPGAVSLSTDEFTHAAGGRGDPLLALQSLPGVGRGPLGLGILSLRGGSPEESQFFVNGLKVPFAFHWGGLSAALPPDAIESVDYLPGGSPPALAQGLSGAVQLNTRHGSEKARGVTLDVSPIAAAGLAEGPTDEQSSALAAARRSYVDAAIQAVESSVYPSGVTFVPSADDYFAELALRRGHATLDAFAFGSDDGVGVSGPQTPGTHLYSNRFHRFGLRIDVPGDATLFELEPYGGLNHVSLGLYGYDRLRDETLGGVRTSLERRWSNAALVVGADLSGGQRTLSIDEPPALPVDQTDPVGSYPPILRHLTAGYLDAAGYADLRLTLGNLLFSAGVRVDKFATASGVYASLRLLGALPAGPGTLRIGGGYSAQGPAPEAVDPVVGAGPLPPSRSLHGDASWEVALPGQLTASVGGFGRYETDLLAQRLSFVPYEQWLELFGFAPSGPTTGGARARAYGMEVFLRRRRAGHWFGWLSYSLSVSERQESADEPWHPAPFDQRHAFAAVVGWEWGQTRASARFRYATGRRYTQVQGTVFDSDRGTPYPEPGLPFSGQLPSFHELDLRLEHRWLLRRVALTAYLDVENAYDYQPVEGAIYSPDFKALTYVRGLFILPYFGVRAEL